jgi:hypothetical protein
MSISPIELTLSAPKGPARIGIVFPVHVEVKNISAGPIWIVGVLDGSEAAYRFPHYKPSITRPRPIAPAEVDGCGNVAPLRLEDFRQLAAGERFDPTEARGGAAYLPLLGLANFIPTDAGRYEIRLHLSTESAEPEEWLGMLGYPGEAQVIERLKAVPRMRVESNTLILEAA